MKPENLVLNNREILPISNMKFGVIVTEKEASKFLDDGYKIKSGRRRGNESIQYYIEVNVDARQGKTIYIAVFDWADRANVVISPVPWTAGKRSGIKAYAESAEKCS